MFQSVRPVTGPDFYDRENELAELGHTIRSLKGGQNRHMAIISQRKVGKTSLVLHFFRTPSAKYVMPIYIIIPDNPGLSLFHYIFSTYLETLAQTSIGHLISKSEEPLVAKGILLLKQIEGEIKNKRIQDKTIQDLFEFSEQWAREYKKNIVIFLDEFQYLEKINQNRNYRHNNSDILSLLRNTIQKQKRVNYVIAGSAYHTMQQLIDDSNSPFYQHFTKLILKPFDIKYSTAIIKNGLADMGKMISSELIRDLHQITGGVPYYLQIIGESLGRLRTRNIGETHVKLAIQDTLFEPSGRLSIYFERIVTNYTAKSTPLRRLLEVIAENQGQIGSYYSSALGIQSGALYSYLDQVKDLIQIEKSDDGAKTYRIEDPLLSLWLLANKLEHPLTCPTFLGDENEKQVGMALSEHGIQPYFSKGSRSFIDIIGRAPSYDLAVQVTSRFRVPRAKLDGLVSVARQRAEIPLLAVVSRGQTYLFDPRTKKKTARGYVFDPNKSITNLFKYCNQE